LRFLLPSVRDIVFIFLFWSLVTGPLSNRPLADPDIGWHIRTGERILATHSLPRTDTFSSTMHGQPWFAWEWLYDILLGILHHACGLNGVVWLCALLVAAVFTMLLAQLLRRGAGLLLAIMLMLLAETAATIHLYARPHIVSWLFSLLWFVVLERWERCEHARPPRWIFWFFPASMLLWVNLHGGWLFGMALLVIYSFAALVESWRTRKNDALAATRAMQRARAMAAAFVAAAAATLANPYGWRLHAHIYRYLSDRYLMDHIEEFRSPDFHGWGERGFVAILALTLIAFADRRYLDAAISENRTSENCGNLRISRLLVVLLAVYAGFYASRNLPVSSMLLALVAGPMLWANFVALEKKPGAWAWLRNGVARIAEFSGRMGAQEMQLRGHLWPVVSVVLALAICLHGGWLGSRQLIHAQFDPMKVPVAAVNFLLEESAGKQPSVHPNTQPSVNPNADLNTSPIFSTDSWGGYLIYRMNSGRMNPERMNPERMYPERQVVVDDRHDLYGSERVRQYVILIHGEPGWQSVVEKWQVQTALLPADSTLANLLRELPQDWRVVYEDKVVVVFEKR
jgi:hypothetical protein